MLIMSTGFSPGDVPEPPRGPVDYVAKGHQEEAGRAKAGFWENLWVIVSSGPACWVSYLIAGTIDTIDRLLTVIGKFSLKAQGEQSPEFDRLVAVLVGDLLGIEVNLDEVSAKAARSTRTQKMQQVGGRLFETLEKEFAPSGVINEDQGVKAAKAFLGFVMSFAIREGNMAVITELISAGIVHNFRDFGVTMARNLGLGRLIRLAMRPLIDETIAQPMQWGLRTKYRPTVLSEATAIKAWIRGNMSEARMMRDLHRKGFRDDDIETLKLEHLRHINEDHIFRSFRWGALNLSEAAKELVGTGMDLVTAVRVLNDDSRKRADSHEARQLDEIVKARKARLIDSQQFQNELIHLHLTQTEKEAILHEVGFVLENPTRRLSIAETRKAFLDGIVDLNYVRNFLEAEGFNRQDQLVLQLQWLLDHQNEDEKKKSRAAQVELKRLRELERKRREELRKQIGPKAVPPPRGEPPPEPPAA